MPRHKLRHKTRQDTHDDSCRVVTHAIKHQKTPGHTSTTHVADTQLEDDELKQATLVTEQFMGCSDYIFYSSETLKPMQLMT